MNKLLILAMITGLAQASIGANPGRALEPATRNLPAAKAARPLETLAAHESLIKIEKAGIVNPTLRAMVVDGTLSADALKTYTEMLDKSTTSAETKSSVRNILETLGNEKDLLGAKGNRLKAIQTYQRFVKEVAPALIKENNADAIELLTSMGQLVKQEGGSVAIYRAVGTKFKIDGQKALDKIDQLKICDI